jgi:hypothetical protein
MGNAMKFLEEKEKRDKERERERAKKARKGLPTRSAPKKDCVHKIVKKCECCEKNFEDIIKTVGGRSYQSKFCDECGKPNKAKLRKQVKSAGSWQEYERLKRISVKYNDSTISDMDRDELIRQRGYRKGLGVSFKDLQSAIDKKDEDA